MGARRKPVGRTHAETRWTSSSASRTPEPCPPDACQCHARDIVGAIAEPSQRTDAYGEVFNLGSTEEISIWNLVRGPDETAADLAQASVAADKVPDRSARARGDATRTPTSRRGDTHVAHRALQRDDTHRLGPALRAAAAGFTLLLATACLFGTIVPAAPAPARSTSTVLKAIWGPATRNGVSLFPTYRALGVKIYEDSLDWDLIAAVRRPQHPTDPNATAYAWPAEITQAVAEAKRYHMQVALQIVGTPPWANGGKAWNWAPLNPQDYANFAIAAARRYPSVHLWMIWGEPSRSANFEPLTPAKPLAALDAQQQVAPHNYARILDAAYGALKSVSRSNVVIGGMTYTSGDISTVQWIENLRLPDGKPPRLDMYGQNPFSFRAPSLSNPPSPDQQIDFSDLGRLTTLVDHYLGRPGNPDPKLFLSEWTIPTMVDQEFDYYVDPSVQAQWITDGLALAQSLGSVYAVGWIHLYDDPPVSYGGLIQTDGTKKPGYFAWRDG
jgi:hypothetical protein